MYIAVVRFFSSPATVLRGFLLLTGHLRRRRIPSGLVPSGSQDRKSPERN